MYGRCGAVEEAERVFTRIPAVDRDIVSLSTLLTAYAATGRGRDALRLYNEALSAGTRLNTVSVSLTLQALGHAHLVEDARAVFAWARMQNDIEVDERLWTVYVTALARSGELAEAEQVLQEMPSVSVVALRSLLGACRTYLDVSRAERIFMRICEV
eukprot:EC723203.1.p2 GENE.EC723203.1~~EC723203.1.p2  ORF type:complete len:168 (+),score=20.30 EC723203.1:35-505(+)